MEEENKTVGFFSPKSFKISAQSGGRNCFEEIIQNSSDDAIKERAANWQKDLKLFLAQGDVTKVVELTQQKGWPNSQYPLEKIMADYMEASVLEGMDVWQGNDVGKKLREFLGVINDPDVPAIAQLIGADKNLDRIDGLLGTVDVGTPAHRQLERAKSSLTSVVRTALIKKDPASVPCDVSVDVSNIDQVELYGDIEWAKPLNTLENGKVSLKEKLLKQIETRIEQASLRGKNSYVAMDDVRLAIIAGRMNLQLKKPIGVEQGLNIFATAARSLSTRIEIKNDTVVGGLEKREDRLQALKHMLVNGDARTISTIMRNLDTSKDSELDLMIRRMDDPQEILGLFKVLDTAKSRLNAMPRDNMSQTQKDMVFAATHALDPLIGQKIFSKVEIANVVLPHMESAHPLALGEEGLAAAESLRRVVFNTASKPQQMLDKVVAQGAVTMVDVQKRSENAATGVGGQPESNASKTAHAFGTYYATIEDKSQRDDLKRTLSGIGLDQSKSPKVASYALGLMKVGQKAYLNNQNPIFKFGYNIADMLFHNGRFRNGLKQKMQMTP